MCPECAFTFDAMHTGPGDDYTCPLCHPDPPARPEGVPDAVRILIERWRDQAIAAATAKGMPNAPAQPSDYDVWTCAAELAGAFGVAWLPYQPTPPERPETVREHFNGHCCADDPECEHSFLDEYELRRHLDSPAEEADRG